MRQPSTRISAGLSSTRSGVSGAAAGSATAAVGAGVLFGLGTASSMGAPDSDKEAATGAGTFGSRPGTDPVAERDDAGGLLVSGISLALWLIDQRSRCL